MTADEAIKPGDRFLVEVEARADPSDSRYCLVVTPYERARWHVEIPSAVLLASKRLPGAIKEGDPVNDTSEGVSARVLWVDEVGALVENEDTEPPRWYADIADLTLVEGRDDE